MKKLQSYLRWFSYYIDLENIIFEMIRRAQTRAGQRQQFYHESEINAINFVSNDIIRPPTSHPYGGYKNKKS